MGRRKNNKSKNNSKPVQGAKLSAKSVKQVKEEDEEEEDVKESSLKSDEKCESKSESKLESFTKDEEKEKAKEEGEEDTEQSLKEYKEELLASSKKSSFEEIERTMDDIAPENSLQTEDTSLPLISPSKESSSEHSALAPSSHPQDGDDDEYVEVTHLDFSPETVRLSIGQLDDDDDDNNNNKEDHHHVISSTLTSELKSDYQLQDDLLAYPSQDDILSSPEQQSPQSRLGRIEITDSTPDDLILEGILSGSDELSATYGLHSSPETSLLSSTIFPPAPPSTPSAGSNISSSNNSTLAQTEDMIPLETFIESISVPMSSSDESEVVKSKLVNLSSQQQDEKEEQQFEDEFEITLDSDLMIEDEGDVNEEVKEEVTPLAESTPETSLPLPTPPPPPVIETLPAVSLPTPLQPTATSLSSTPLNESSDESTSQARRRPSFKDTAEYTFIESLPSPQSSTTSQTESLSLPSAKISVSEKKSENTESKPEPKTPEIPVVAASASAAAIPPTTPDTSTNTTTPTPKTSTSTSTSTIPPSQQAPPSSQPQQSQQSSSSSSSSSKTNTSPNVERRVVLALTLRVLNELRIREILTRDAIGNVKDYLFDGHKELTEAAIQFIKFKNLDPLLSVIFQLVGMKEIM